MVFGNVRLKCISSWAEFLAVRTSVAWRGNMTALYVVLAGCLVLGRVATFITCKQSTVSLVNLRLYCIIQGWKQWFSSILSCAFWACAFSLHGVLGWQHYRQNTEILHSVYVWLLYGSSNCCSCLMKTHTACNPRCLIHLFAYFVQSTHPNLQRK